jgi:hypothetical protein
MATDGYQDLGTRQTGRSSNAAGQGVAYWGDAPETYDTVVLAGFVLPGLCSIKGKGYEMRKRDVRPTGKNGNSTYYLANEPAEFDILVMMTTKEHLQDFEKLVPLFKPSQKPRADAKIGNPDNFTYAFTGQSSGSNNGSVLLGRKKVLTDDSRPGYLSVSHPLLALFRISHCRVLQVSIPEQLEDKGMWQVKLQCIEEVLEGNRKAKTGRTGDAGIIAGRKTAYDAALANATAPPSVSNAGPPP